MCIVVFVSIQEQDLSMVNLNPSIRILCSISLVYRVKEMQMFLFYYTTQLYAQGHIEKDEKTPCESLYGRRTRRSIVD